MKKTSKKQLRLETQTVRALQGQDLANAAGGYYLYSVPVTHCSCQISCGCAPGA